MDDVQLVPIDKELKKLHAAQAERKEVRASLFTLIIYVHEEKRAGYLREIVQNVIEKYPCRIIFIKADRTPEASMLKVSVSSAQNNKGGAVVACDQINIEVGSKYINRVPYLILPHILTDLPVYLLWGQDATSENEILPKLEGLADRLIFDAECTKSFKQFTQAILDKKKHLAIDLIDINWALSSAWRDVITKSFYLQEHLEQLRKTRRLVIVYNSRGNDWVQQPEMQAIYIQAWIASRLGWQFKEMNFDGKERLFVYRTGEGDAEVRLIPQELPDVPPGGIQSFAVDSSDGFHMIIDRDTALSRITFHCSSDVSCELPLHLPLPNIRRGFAFMNEIFYSSPSPHYIQALELLNRIGQ